MDKSIDLNLNFVQYTYTFKYRVRFEYITRLKINKYIYSILEELLIYNEVKRNGFNNIFNVQADFKNNDIYQYILDNDI